MTDDITGRVPQADPNAGMQKAIWAEVRRQGAQIDRQGAQIDKLLRAVTVDPLDPDPDAKPGLVQVQKDHGDRLDDQADRLAVLEAAHEKQADRWVTLGIDLFKTIAGGVIGAVLALKGGTHQ